MMDCSVFDLIGSDKWRRASPLRDVIDLFIVVFISNTQRIEKIANITSIAEFLGISRATATRRIQHLTKSGMIRSTRRASSLLVSLTEQGERFISSVLGESACKSLQSLQLLNYGLPAVREGARGAESRDGALDAETLFETLSTFQQAMGSHMAWLVQWYHRMLNWDRTPVSERADCAVCRFEALFTESAFGTVTHNYGKVLFDHAEIHRLADGIEAILSTGGTVEGADLEALIERVVTFATSIQQMERDIWQVIAMLDPLTGLGNRHLMLPRLRSEQVRAERQSQPCCLAIGDIDHFKKVNDTYGHVQGDRILRLIAQQLQAGTRPYDLLFRYGGEEFLICLPGASMETAVQILDRLRVNITKTVAAEIPDLPHKVTCTIGVAEMVPGLSVEDVIAQADTALYEGKAKGRNTVAVHAREMA